MNDYITISEASKRSRYSKRQIQKLAEKGIERIRTKKLDNGHRLYNIKDIIQYASAHPEKIILNTVWDEINFIESECFFPLFDYDFKYFVTNKERVVNSTNGQVLTPRLRKQSGYKQVSLMREGKIKAEYFHRLVAQTQCPNSLNKRIVHHIKISNPSIDKASNLLWVWKWQHDKLHLLLKEDKREEYKEMVNSIKKENKQKIYKIPHLDFESDESMNYYMYLTYDGYRAYKSGEKIPIDSIVRETAEPKGE